MKKNRYSRALEVYRETSGQAWASVRDELSAVDAAIWMLVSRPGSATCDEIEVLTGFKHQTVAAQIRHMTEAGLIEPSNEKRPTRSGRAAIVWQPAQVQPQGDLFTRRTA